MKLGGLGLVCRRQDALAKVHARLRHGGLNLLHHCPLRRRGLSEVPSRDVQGQVGHGRFGIRRKCTQMSLKPGDTIEYNGLKFDVDRVERRRVISVRLELHSDSKFPAAEIPSDPARAAG